jgi:hypothetical protein
MSPSRIPAAIEEVNQIHQLVRTYGASFVGQKWAVEVLNVSLQVQLRCLILEPLLTAAP